MHRPPELSGIHFSCDERIRSKTYHSARCERIFTGAYLETSRLTSNDQWERQRQLHEARAQAAIALFADRGAILYGPTALTILGVALPEQLQDWDNCHLLLPDAANRIRRRGIVSHRAATVPPIHQWIRGLPTLHPIDHLLQLPDASADELIEVADGFFRRQSPLLTWDDALRHVNRRKGSSGIKRIRSILGRVLPGTDSLYETRTRLILVHAGLPQPAVNLPVFCPSAQMTYHLDMGYELEKVAVEYDGAVHVGDRRQMEIDANRRRILQDEGWLIISVTAGQLQHPQDIIRSVESALILRRAELKDRF